MGGRAVKKESHVIVVELPLIQTPSVDALWVMGGYVKRGSIVVATVKYHSSALGSKSKHCTTPRGQSIPSHLTVISHSLQSLVCQDYEFFD